MKWHASSLGQVTTRIRNGLNIRQTADAGGLPITRIETISNQVVNPKRVGFAGIGDGEKSDWYLTPGEILFSHINSEERVGICALYEGEPYPLVHGMNLLSLMPNENKILPKFLLYSIRSPQFRLCLTPIIKRAVNQASVSIGNLKDIEIQLPTPSEQRRIVEILDQADALRKKRIEADAKAARILPALFYKMVGDPFTNPKGWPIGNLGDVTIDLRYGTSVRCDSEDKGLPVLRIPNIVSGHIDLDDLKYAELPRSDVRRLLLKDGDLLFVRTNGNRDYVGRCAVFELSGEYLFASYLIRARLDRTKVDPKFVSVSLGTPMGRQAMSPYIRTTAGQSNIGQEGLRQIRLIIPTLDVQNTFCQRVQELEREEEERRNMKQKLDTLFQVLLHRAFTGELTAKWREAHMKELLAEMEEQARLLGGQCPQ